MSDGQITHPAACALCTGQTHRLTELGVYDAFKICELDNRVKRLVVELDLLPAEMRKFVDYFQRKLDDTLREAEALGSLPPEDLAPDQAAMQEVSCA